MGRRTSRAIQTHETRVTAGGRDGSEGDERRSKRSSGQGRERREHGVLCQQPQRAQQIHARRGRGSVRNDPTIPQHGHDARLNGTNEGDQQEENRNEREAPLLDETGRT
eukprot:scaffold587_cov339-Pavlova_lutheri.AAC.3